MQTPIMRFSFPPLPGGESPRQPADPEHSADIDHFSFGGTCAIPPSEAPPPPAPVASADLVAAVRRLTHICADYLASAPRLNLHPTPSHLLRIVDAALAEAAGGPPTTWGDDVEGYFLHGLYEELIQQPTNLFTGTRLIHGEEVPVPISPANWIECLNVLRAAILRGDVALSAAPPNARYLGARRPGHVFVPVPGAADPAAALRSPPAHLAAIKQWTRDILGLAEDDVVTVNELACRDPGCPLLETIIAVFAEGVTMRWKFARPGCAVTKTMLRQTLTTAPQ